MPPHVAVGHDPRVEQYEDTIVGLPPDKASKSLAKHQARRRAVPAVPERALVPVLLPVSNQGIAEARIGKPYDDYLA